MTVFHSNINQDVPPVQHSHFYSPWAMREHQVCEEAQCCIKIRRQTYLRQGLITHSSDSNSPMACASRWRQAAVPAASLLPEHEGKKSPWSGERAEAWCDTLARLDQCLRVGLNATPQSGDDSLWPLQAARRGLAVGQRCSRTHFSAFLWPDDSDWKLGQSDNHYVQCAPWELLKAWWLNTACLPRLNLKFACLNSILSTLWALSGLNNANRCTTSR